MYICEGVGEDRLQEDVRSSMDAVQEQNARVSGFAAKPQIATECRKSRTNTATTEGEYLCPYCRISGGFRHVVTGFNLDD